MRLFQRPGWRLAAALCLCPCIFAQILERGRPIEGNLKGGESRSYQLPATTGQFFAVTVHPNGLPLKVRLLAPSGAEIATVVNAAAEQRDLPVSHIARETGTYHLELVPTDSDAPARTYVLNLTELRVARPADETRIAAEQTFQAGKQLQAEESKESLQQAIAKFESALPLWRAVADQAQEGRTLDAMGDTYWSLSELAKAQACFEQALPLAKTSHDTVGEASALNNLGVAAMLTAPQKAIEYLEQSLPLSRAARRPQPGCRDA